MKENINEDVLCILRKNNLKNQIEIDYITIEKPLAKIIDNFSSLCDNPKGTLQQLVNFINTTTELNKLTAYYRYCVDLGGSYQAFSANNQDTITEIANQYQIMLINQKNDPRKYDIYKAIADYKEKLRDRYILWNKAFSINIAYRLCHEDKSILMFSHCINGWSSPVYQLTTNFSVEIKTNFGYGRASYFYTKLKYKNTEITPFSEWIDYEFAKFSEIVRYTQSHILENEYWLEAMEFSRDACNLSMTDEVKFVEKYVIDECEIMVNGLEEIFNKEQFLFKKRGKNRYTVDKKGHVLVEFRGEKISGALDFISKILEFEKITSIKSFINRIEACNKRIQPILVSESKILKIKISNFTEKQNSLKPKYDKLIEDYYDYNTKKIDLKKLLICSGQLDVNRLNTVKLDNEFNSKYPDYKKFYEEYKKVTDSFRIITEHIQNLSHVYENIITYNEKITRYFGN